MCMSVHEYVYKNPWELARVAGSRELPQMGALGIKLESSEEQYTLLTTKSPLHL